MFWVLFIYNVHPVGIPLFSVIQPRISAEADISVCRVLSGRKVLIKSERSVGQYAYWILMNFWRKNILPTSSGRKSECVELPRENIMDFPWVRKLFPVPPPKGLFLSWLLFAHVWRYSGMEGGAGPNSFHRFLKLLLDSKNKIKWAKLQYLHTSPHRMNGMYRLDRDVMVNFEPGE